MLQHLFATAALTGISLTSPVNVERSASCTAEQRLAGAQRIIDAYAAVPVGGSAELFNKLPVSDDCHTYM